VLICAVVVIADVDERVVAADVVSIPINCARVSDVPLDRFTVARPLVFDDDMLFKMI
jgi:hypothetical protein